jgi:hypothetical protein
LLALAQSQTLGILDWKQFNAHFGVMVGANVSNTMPFFCSGIKSDDTFALGRQGICITDTLVNHVHHKLWQWRSQESSSSEVLSALAELIKALSNCPGLSECQQSDFIKKSDAPDLPLHDIHIPESDHSFYSETLTPGQSWYRGDVAGPDI